MNGGALRESCFFSSGGLDLISRAQQALFHIRGRGEIELLRQEINRGAGPEARELKANSDSPPKERRLVTSGVGCPQGHLSGLFGLFMRQQ